MVTRDTHLSALPLTDRLSFRLILLFALVFFTVFFGTWVYDALASFAESRLAEAALSGQPAPIVIDPKLQTELAKVMAFDAIPTEADVRDPFNDRSGLSNVVKLSGAPAAAPQRTSVQPGSSQTVAGSTGGGSGGMRNYPGQSVGGQSGGISMDPAVSREATRDRYLQREERIRAGMDGGPEAEVFSIEDLLPVGVVSGGDEKEEVMFYSQTADRTFSFPVGTRFFDGWLTALRPEGVVFSTDDQYRTARMKSWGRSIKSGTAERVSVFNSPESALTGVNN